MNELDFLMLSLAMFVLGRAVKLCRNVATTTTLLREGEYPQGREY